MNILLITQWYKPIKGAAARRTTKIADSLSQAGNHVDVLTGFPSYPTGKLDKVYQQKLWQWNTDGKTKILRIYEYPTASKGKIKRILNMISFSISAIVSVLILPRYDKIIVSSPSFISGIAGLLASRLWQADFYFDVRDLWPDSAIDLGFLKQKFLIRVLKYLEKLYYKKSVKIFVATPEIKRHLISENISQDKIITLINSVDTSQFKPQQEDRKQYGYQVDDFLVCYIGNHSPVYDLKTIIKVAKKLEKYPKIKFLFVGEGENKEKLVNLKNDLKLVNVKFMQEQPPETLVKIINLSDIGLVPINPIQVSQNAFPAKVSEYFACGKPVAASIGGDMAKIIKDNQVGLLYPPNKVVGATKTILKLYSDPNLRQKMGRNARQLSISTFADKIFYQKLHKEFN